MKIIGITGPTGAGKSFFSEYLAERGIPVIDADEVYHALLVPPSACLDALRSAFGEGVFREDGTLNRPALSEIVFHDEKKLQLLNETVLGFVLDQIRGMLRDLAQEGNRAVAVDAPTLIESGFDRECDTVVSILAPAQERLRRIVARDHITEERAHARIDSQQPDDFYRRHSHAVLINDGDGERLRREAEALLDALLPD